MKNPPQSLYRQQGGSRSKQERTPPAVRADACLKLRGDRAAKRSPREVLHNMPRKPRPPYPATADGPSSDIPFSGTSAFFVFKESAKGNTGMRRRREAELTPENPSRSNDLHNPGLFARGSTVPFSTGRSTIEDAQPPASAGWFGQEATFNRLNRFAETILNSGNLLVNNHVTRLSDMIT